MKEKIKAPPPLITHYCEDCGEGFQVPQGSLRKYCDKHLVDRVTAGKKKEESK